MIRPSRHADMHQIDLGSRLGCALIAVQHLRERLLDFENPAGALIGNALLRAATMAAKFPRRDGPWQLG